MIRQGWKSLSGLGVSMFVVPGLISLVCLILGVSLLVQMKRPYLGEGEDAG